MRKKYYSVSDKGKLGKRIPNARSRTLRPSDYLSLDVVPVTEKQKTRGSYNKCSQIAVDVTWDIHFRI